MEAVASAKKARVALRKSWIPVEPKCPFPIQNLPYGVFTLADGVSRIGVAIGDQVLDLRGLADANLLRGEHIGDGSCFQEPVLNRFMGMGKAAWSEARAIISHLLDEDTAVLRDSAELRAKVLNPQALVEMRL